MSFNDSAKPAEVISNCINVESQGFGKEDCGPITKSTKIFTISYYKDIKELSRKIYCCSSKKLRKFVRAAI